MNPSALLALISDLYGQIIVLQQELDRLRGSQTTDPNKE